MADSIGTRRVVQPSSARNFYLDPEGRFSILGGVRGRIEALLKLNPYAAALAFVNGEISVDGDLVSAIRFFLQQKHSALAAWCCALLAALEQALPWRIELGSRYLDKGQLKVPSGLIGYALLSMPAAAMGLQTVTVTRINGLRVYTTYLTGTLSKFSEAAVSTIYSGSEIVRESGYGLASTRCYACHPGKSPFSTPR